MKMRRYKKLGLRILLLCFMILTFSACGGNKPTGSGIAENNGGSGNAKISRADYIGLVGQIFGYDTYEATSDFFSDVSASNKNYNAVQACAEWNVIAAGDKFNPNQEATLDFALATAVRAIGVEDLGLEENVNDQRLTDFYVNNIAQLDKSNLNSGLSEDTGRQILQFALAYRNDMELPQKIDVEFQEGIKEANNKISLPISGNTGTLKDGHGYVVGDVIYFEDTPSHYPRGVKITAISGNRFTFEDVSVEEVFSKLEISGTFDGEIVNAFSASDNISILEEEIFYPQARAKYQLSPVANGVRMDVGKDHATFIATMSKEGKKAEFQFGIKNIKITTDYKHGMTVLDPKELKLNVKYDTVIESYAELHESRTIPLGSLDIQVWGPLFVKMSLTANIGADGKIELNYTLHNSSSLEWKKGNGITKSFTSESSAILEGDITLTAEVTAMADLAIEFLGSHSLANVQATTGVVVIAKEDADLLGNKPTCVDVFGYVPLRWGVNQKGCLITKINSAWKLDGTVWDSKTSKITFHFHWEDGVRTANDECLRDKGEEVVQENEKPDGSPLDEYELFDFTPISFDFIQMKEYVTFIQPNNQYEIIFTSIPGDYTKTTLVYEVEDRSVCSVSGGVVTGLKAGSTLVKISTSDGMFSATFVVIVNDDYSIEGEWKPL